MKTKFTLPFIFAYALAVSSALANSYSETKRFEEEICKSVIQLQALDKNDALVKQKLLETTKNLKPNEKKRVQQAIQKSIDKSKKASDEQRQKAQTQIDLLLKSGSEKPGFSLNEKSLLKSCSEHFLLHSGCVGLSRWSANYLMQDEKQKSLADEQTLKQLQPVLEMYNYKVSSVSELYTKCENMLLKFCRSNSGAIVYTATCGAVDDHKWPGVEVQ